LRSLGHPVAEPHPATLPREHIAGPRSWGRRGAKPPHAGRISAPLHIAKQRVARENAEACRSV
jgi:hypothetical protein